MKNLLKTKNRKKLKRALDGLLYSSFCLNLRIFEFIHFLYTSGNDFTQIKHKRSKKHIHFQANWLIRLSFRILPSVFQEKGSCIFFSINFPSGCSDKRFYILIEPDIPVLKLVIYRKRVSRKIMNSNSFGIYACFVDISSG